MLVGSSVCYADNISDSRTVIGADLDSDEIATVYKSFGIERGEVKELTVTNADERKYLEGQVDESLIGTRSIILTATTIGRPSSASCVVR